MVNKGEGCWEWAGTKVGKGYGRFTVGSGVKMVAHRYSYERLVGPIPEGMQIDHLCRNRPCVNPAHLEAVTPEENLRRAYAAIGPKMVCVNGHPKTDENLFISGGKRRCRECCRAQGRERAARRKAERSAA